jgi:hypothetical protein
MSYEEAEDARSTRPTLALRLSERQPRLPDGDADMAEG